MRMWIGNEMEGSEQGVKTLFVESVNVAEIEKKIVDIAKENGIKRIYFGAGRKDVLLFNPCFLNFLKDEGFCLVLETSVFNVYNAMLHKVWFNNIILRLDVGIDAKNTQLDLKIDNGKDVWVYSKPIKTSLKDLENGMYLNEDIEIK